MSDQQPNQDGNGISAKSIAISIAGGIALGTPIWLALNNLGVGIAVGIALGVAIWAGTQEARKKRNGDQDS